LPYRVKHPIWFNWHWGVGRLRSFVRRTNVLALPICHQLRRWRAM